ncbi:MAG TPA: metallophosphoesterase [Polyangia bacterium]|nr:metallophosphoesterase [Polyangia bacterium]
MRFVLGTLCCSLVVASLSTGCQKATAGGERATPVTSNSGGFSFAVYGDSRSMMYLPYQESQKAEAQKLMVDLFSIAMPEILSDIVVRRKVKMFYDPTSHELVQLVMPFESRSEVATMRLDKGWVTEASVEDKKLLPGVSRTMFRLEGGEWVAREVVKDVQRGRARFILNTGDMVWWGKQGASPSENPYWTLVNETVLKQLPAPDEEMRSAGLPGRVFPAVGNHEVWEDSDVEGLLASFPYLRQLGVSNDRLIYKMDFKGTRFIFLWTGKYDHHSPSSWTGTRPNYEEQMTQLREWLDDAKATGKHQVFVSFHAPAFARSGMGAIPEKQNPHSVLAAYAKDLDIVVFNGHVHTTELYDVDGVKYLLLGGGGAEQDPILPGRTSIKVPANYPADQYWRGEPPQEDYNYVLVDVQPGLPARFTLNRFRPGSSEPFATVELFRAP